MRVELISQVPLFACLPGGEIEYLAATLRPHTIPEQTLLFLEGQADDFFYILLQGQVEIIKALGTDAERLLGVREAGSLIGEMSLLSRDKRHTASVRARTPVEVLEMSGTEFDALLRRQPALAHAIVQMLSGRLDESENRTIRDLMEKNRELRQAYDELKAAQAQLIEKERLEAELDVARAIQRSILPRARPNLPGFDVGVRIEPMQSVGGDFYDFIPLGEGRLGIVIGDVSGHGVPAALFMALTFSWLHAEAGHGRSPAEALHQLNEHLLGMNESNMFVTLLYGILDSQTGEFRYARAGHEIPVLLDAAGEPIELAEGVGQILGLFPGLVVDEGSIHLEPASLLVLYTDGVNEAMDPERNQFGLEGLLAALRAQRARGAGLQSAQDTCDGIYETVRAHVGGQPAQDDILVIAVRAK